MKRVLIIGAGSIAKKHLTVVANVLPDAEILVYSPSEKCSFLDPTFTLTSNLQQCVNFAPSFVIIASPSNSHIFYSEMFLGLASGILIEKPVGIDVSEGRAFLEKSSKSSTYIQIGYNLRYFESLCFFRNIIHKKKFGELYSIQSQVAQHLTLWRPGIDYRHTVSAKSSNGGGVLFELSHELDYLIWIMGNPNSISGWAARVSDLDIDVEDFAIVNFFYEQEASKRAVPVSITMNFIDHQSQRTCTAICQNGTVHWDALTGIVKVFRKETNTPEVLLSIKEELHASYDKQFEKFLANSLHGHKKNLSLQNVNEAVNLLEIIEKIRDSSYTGGKVIGV